jgi:hypothetical protein
MTFSEKIIDSMFKTINKEENKSFRGYIIETAVKTGKIPLDPTDEQIQSVQTDFMVIAFYHLIMNNKDFYAQFEEEIYHALRNEPCDQF